MVKMSRHTSLLLAIMLIGTISCLAIFAGLLAPYPPDAIDPNAILSPPSAAHWAGTDEVGRDIFSRILFGARPSLLVAFSIIAIAASGGVVIGSASGLAGGLIDTIIMRVVELIMSMPGLVIALSLTAALGPSLVNLTLALGLLGIPYYARIARGQTLLLREREYVRAARTMSAGGGHIFLRHVLPNLLPTVVVFMSLGLSGALLGASALSFIGLGAQPPMAEWGALVNASREYMLNEWWYALFPGFAVAITSLGFTLLGDGLRDYLDTKARP